MAETKIELKVRLVTPDKIHVDQVVEAVELPSKSGYIEVLPGHAPLLAELGAGTVTMHFAGAESKRFFVAWGFVEVLPERVTILAENAVKPEEIDKAEAERELKTGEELWSEAGDNAGKYAEANDVISEAEAKLAAANNRT